MAATAHHGRPEGAFREIKIIERIACKNESLLSASNAHPPATRHFTARRPANPATRYFKLRFAAGGKLEFQTRRLFRPERPSPHDHRRIVTIKLKLQLNP